MKKKKIIISISVIFLILMLILGLTYAYFRTRVIGNNSNVPSINVTSKLLQLTYADGSANISVSGIEPSDTLYSKTFTVTNGGNEEITYGVYLINVINTFERKDDIKYTLTCTEGCNGRSNETFPSGISQLTTNTIASGATQTYTLSFVYANKDENQSVDMGKTLSAKIQIFVPDEKETYFPYEEGTLAYNMINRALNATGTSTIFSDPETTPAETISGVTSYKTTVEEGIYVNMMSSISSNTSKTWYYYDTYTVDVTTGNFTLSGKHSCTYNLTTINTDGETVNCYDDMKGKYLYGDSASSNSNANNHTAETKTNLSKVYKVTSATIGTLNYVALYSSPLDAERVLAPTTDDYGTSYYYRGDIEDNYVNFAGMCWRIVRIEGDGSVKLILEDRYTTCDDTEDTDGAGPIDYKYTGNWSDNKTYVFGYDDSTGSKRLNFLNYKGGLADSFKSFQSKLIAKINTIYPSETINDKLKVDEWCYDNEVTATSGLNEYYGAYTRISTNNKPSLNCTGTKLTKFKDGTDMYVATLTADEMSFAGAKTGTNYNYYLMNNYSKSGSKGLNFWSLSPKRFYEVNSADEAFYLNMSGIMYSNSVYYYSFSSRPAITLKSGSVIAGGEGTIENPYVIK